MNPSVSVLTTCYNREKYLPGCIESVLASTFRDFEYIIVDDGSTDRSHELALAYVKKDPRIRVYRNQKNLGDYPNRNQAASYAVGKYLKYLDSDDLIYPFGLQVMVRSMEKFPEAALGLCRPQSQHSPYPFQVSSRDACEEHFLGPGLFVNAPSSVIIRADAFRAVGGFSGKRFVGDRELWLKLAALCPVVKIATGLTWYRYHEGQEQSLELNQPEPIDSSYQISLETLLTARGLMTPARQQAALCRLKQHHARHILSLALHGRLRVARNVYCRSGLTIAEMLRGLRRRI